MRRTHVEKQEDPSQHLMQLPKSESLVKSLKQLAPGACRFGRCQVVKRRNGCIIPPNHEGSQGPCPPGSHKRRRAFLQGRGDQLQSPAELAGATHDAAPFEEEPWADALGRQRAEAETALVTTGHVGATAAARRPFIRLGR